ncbi:hypothetical protein [Archangium sp.]|jgi:hypothetical protein|uniref:hypothetical protein n=1 Tax=Archangium sp. TaxID=1872627 RepID=UPI002ED772E3
MPGPANLYHLEAELVAWPLGSEVSFRLGLDALARTDAGVLSGATQRLSDALLDHLRPRARGLSLEILAQLREGVWFQGEQPPVGSRRLELPLARFVSRLAGSRLHFMGDHAALQPGADSSLEHQAARWRWLSLALPPDLLIAAHAALDGSEPTADFVSLGAPHLERFFEEEGIAQTHLHLGAAVPFEWLWTNLMARISDDALQEARLGKEGRFPLGSAREFLDWLVTAALARLTLGGFLWHLELGEATPFRPFVDRLVTRGRDASEHRSALSALHRGQRPVSQAVLRPVLRRLMGAPPPRSAAQSLEDVRRRDPLSHWLGASTLPETRFMARGLRYLLGPPGSRDAEFARVFWQYLRVRNLTYRHLVLEPGTAGLDWFSVHFRRISALREGMGDRALMASALALESRGPPLKSLEVRTSPSTHWPDIRDLVRHVASAPEPEGTRPERGLVLHFVKGRNTARRDKLPHADPRQLVHGCRFGSYFHTLQREAGAIERTLREHREFLFILRGLDVCNLELAVPTWVFLPILRRLREASARLPRTLAPHGRIPHPLQLTMHSGEDFRRLIEGIRHMHEPVEFGVLGIADRLGHAVALGMEPEAWARSVPFVRQPAEERLDDLLWELDRYRHAELHADVSRMAYIQEQIDRLSTWIYGAGYGSLEEMLRARRLRHQPRFLEYLGYPFMRNIANVEAEGGAGRLLLRYLTDFGVYARGQEPLEVETHPSEVPMLHEAQRFLRALFSRLGITIEANPSSNVLIGDIALDEHPIFRLQPLPGRVGAAGGPVAVSLGDDDPVTFASSLPDEYCHLYYALLRRSVSTQDALGWLDQLRKNGLRARFTLAESIRPREQRSTSEVVRLPRSR